MSQSSTCRQCGREFQRIGTHWRKSDCEYPEFTEKQNEIITGLLLGDGCVLRSNPTSNPRVACNMVAEEYLEYLDEQFPVMGTGVVKTKTSEQAAKEKVDSGFRPDASKEDYQDVYRWYSRNTPRLESYLDWYSTGKKVFPDDIDLTPTVLKHWFVGDGFFDIYNYKVGRVAISTSNEIQNKRKIESYFDNIGFTQYYWKGFERKDGSEGGSIVFSTEITEQLFEYMGEPLPSFEYKWPNNYK